MQVRSRRAGAVVGWYGSSLQPQSCLGWAPQMLITAAPSLACHLQDGAEGPHHSGIFAGPAKRGGWHAAPGRPAATGHPSRRQRVTSAGETSTAADIAACREQLPLLAHCCFGQQAVCRVPSCLWAAAFPRGSSLSEGQMQGVCAVPLAAWGPARVARGPAVVRVGSAAKAGIPGRGPLQQCERLVGPLVADVVRSAHHPP